MDDPAGPPSECRLARFTPGAKAKAGAPVSTLTAIALSAPAAVAGLDDTSTWWLVIAALLACVLASAGAVLTAVHHRRQHTPRYRRHTPTGIDHEQSS